jgi:4-amino-4-deoxy-L-arabinose transferase-like glycosyltransferase
MDMTTPSQKSKQIFLPILLILLSSGFFLFRLGNTALIDYDEATYGQVISEAVQNHQYLTLTKKGQPWFEKPPLYFWLAGLSAKTFGFNEFALRLPAALFGILGIIFTYLLALELSGSPGIAFIAGLVLLTTGEFVFAGRQLRLDVPLSTMILAGVYFFLKALLAQRHPERVHPSEGSQKPQIGGILRSSDAFGDQNNAGGSGQSSKKYYLLFGMALGLSALTKNLVGLFSLPLIIILSLIYKNWSWLKNRYFWGGLVLAGAIITPWHLYESVKFGRKFWDSYLFHHVFQRFASPILGGNITVWNYIRFLFLLVEPWMLVFVLALFWFAADFFSSPKKNSKDFRAAWAMLSLAAFIFTVFAIAKTKLFYYLEPLYPYFAIFLAIVFGLMYQSLPKNWLKKIAIGFLVLLMLAGVANNIWQSFYFRAGVAEDIFVANEEKTIGLQLAAASPTEKAYYYLWTWNETLPFYSGKTIGQLPNPAPPEPYYLIVPATLFQIYQPSPQFQKTSQKLFSGQYLELYRVGENKSE